MVKQMVSDDPWLRTSVRAAPKRLLSLRRRWQVGTGMKNLEEARRGLGEHQGTTVELEEFYKEINASWGNIALRNIGVLEYFPPSPSTSTTKGTPKTGEPSDSTRPSLGPTLRVIFWILVRFD